MCRNMCNSSKMTNVARITFLLTSLKGHYTRTASKNLWLQCIQCLHPFNLKYHSVLAWTCPLPTVQRNSDVIKVTHLFKNTETVNRKRTRTGMKIQIDGTTAQTNMYFCAIHRAKLLCTLLRRFVLVLFNFVYFKWWQCISVNAKATK